MRKTSAYARKRRAIAAQNHYNALDATDKQMDDGLRVAMLTRMWEGLAAKLKVGEIKPGEAAELANLAGKMIASAKVQVEYYALRKEPPEIGFLKDDARRAGEGEPR